jgi:hypothetical protein
LEDNLPRIEDEVTNLFNKCNEANKNTIDHLLCELKIEELTNKTQLQLVSIEDSSELQLKLVSPFHYSLVFKEYITMFLMIYLVSQTIVCHHQVLFSTCSTD